MKSNQSPDLKKIFANKPSAQEIQESHDRARRAAGGAWADRLKPENEVRKPQ